MTDYIKSPIPKNHPSKILTSRSGSFSDISSIATPRTQIKLIVDSDAGTDDATSLMAAFQDPFVEVVAITVVDGNTDLEQGIKNIKTIVSVAGRKDIPIYAGADGPLIRGFNKKELWPGNGIDGLGNVTVSPPEGLVLPGTDDFHVPRNVHAANKLVELVTQNPGEYHILAIGPLTNIAMAIALDPKFLHKIQGLYIMGGCLYAKGNANRSAEFNIHCDPEAAHMVFHASTAYSQSIADEYSAKLALSSDKDSLANETKSVLPPNFVPKIILSTWEMTAEHGFPWLFFDYLTQTEPVNKFGKFLGTFHKCAESLSRSQYEFLSAGPRPMSPVQPVLIVKQEESESTDAADDSESKQDSVVQADDSKEISSSANTSSGTKPRRKKKYKQSRQEEYLCGVQSFLMPDFYALISLLNPHSIVSYKDWDVQVELHGHFTRGMTHFDWFGALNSPPNCRVIMEMDRDIVRGFYERTFKEPL